MEEDAQENGPGDGGHEYGGAGKRFVLDENHVDDAGQSPGSEPSHEQLRVPAKLESDDGDENRKDSL